MMVSTVPMIVAEPVSCNTHHPKAMLCKLSPKRDTVYPDHNKANERWWRVLSMFMLCTGLLDVMQ